MNLVLFELFSNIENEQNFSSDKIEEIFVSDENFVRRKIFLTLLCLINYRRLSNYIHKCYQIYSIHYRMGLESHIFTQENDSHNFQ